MEPLIFGLALGAGALFVAKRGRGALQGAVGWSARKGGWLAGRVRMSLDETSALARAEFERGRRESAAAPRGTLPLSEGEGTGGLTAPVAHAAHAAHAPPAGS